MPSKRLASTVVACTVLALGVTACGPSAGKAPAVAPSPTVNLGIAFDALSAKEITQRAQAAMAGLTSAKVDGSITTDEGVMDIHLATSSEGDCKGTIGIGDAGRTEVLHTGARTWIKPDENLWATMAAQQGHPQAAAAVVQLFRGRYLTSPADDEDLRGAVGMCNLIKGIAEGKDDAGATYAKGAVGAVNGTRSLSIVATGPDGERSTLYIAAEGEPYLLRMEQRQGSEPAQLTFSGFNEPLTVQAPPADLVIDTSVFTDQLTTA